MITEYNKEGQVVEVDSDTIRFVTILDLHLSPVPPVSRKDDFLASTLDALHQARRFAKKMNAQGIILAGDIFHIKTGSRNPHGFVRSVMSNFKEVKSDDLDVLGICGNHDLTFGSLVSLETQPIGVMVEADAMHLLDNKPVTYKGKGFSVKVAGCSYNHAQAAPVRDLKKDGADFLVGVGHFWFGPETGEFFGEPVYGPDYFKDSEVDAFVIGHHHEDMGIPVVGGRTYFTHGSINRIGSHKGDLERRPSVGLLEVTKNGVTGKVARVKVPEVSEVFNLETVKVAQEERVELDKFIEGISQQIMVSTDLNKMVDEMTLPADVKVRVDKYLQEAEEEATK